MAMPLTRYRAADGHTYPATIHWKHLEAGIFPKGYPLCVLLYVPQAFDVVLSLYFPRPASTPPVF